MSKMDLVFVDTDSKGRYCFQISDPGGNVLLTAEDRIDERLKEHGQKFVVFAWQIERVLKELGRNPFGSRAIVDLYHVAWILVAAAPEDVPDRKLETLAHWCSVSLPKDPTLEDRVRVLRECYSRILTRIELGLKVEGVGRAIVSEVTEKAVSMLGKLST